MKRDRLIEELITPNKPTKPSLCLADWTVPYSTKEPPQRFRIQHVLPGNWEQPLNNPWLQHPTPLECTISPSSSLLISFPNYLIN